MKKDTTYKKICKKKRFAGGFDALWSAGDHLLLVRNNMYTQSYKRFFFSDIQALYARVTKSWVYFGLCQGGVSLFFLICALFGNDSIERFIFGGFSGIFLIVLVINLLLGPSCKATIVTRVQSHTLPIGRLSKAKKVFSILRARVEEVQGVLEYQESGDAPPYSGIAGDANAARARDSRANRKKTTTDHSYDGFFHLLFFSGLLIISGMNGMQLYARHMVITFIELLLFIILLIFMVLAMARQKNSTAPDLLKKITWTGLGVIFLLLGMGYIDMLINMFESMAEMGPMQTQLDLIRFYINREPDDYPFFKFTLICHTVFPALVAVFGLWQLAVWRKQRGEVEA